MNEILLAFGRGVVKLLVSAFVGTGVGLLTFGVSVKDTPNFWNTPGPPPGFFLALGAGLLTAGAMMMVTFWYPRSHKAQPLATAKPNTPADWTS